MSDSSFSLLPFSGGHATRAPIDYDHYRADAAAARAAVVRDWVRAGLRGAARLLAGAPARRRPPRVRLYRSEEVF